MLFSTFFGEKKLKNFHTFYTFFWWVPLLINNVDTRDPIGSKNCKGKGVRYSDYHFFSCDCEWWSTQKICGAAVPQRHPAVLPAWPPRKQGPPLPDRARRLWRRLAGVQWRARGQHLLCNILWRQLEEDPQSKGRVHWKKSDISQ